ncbi:MAG: hypothetical protein ACNA8W_17890 [Bradymonadaceae bacterium]
MAEVDLRIKPTIAGSVEGKLGGVRKSVRGMAQEQERGLTRGDRVVRGLGQTYDRLSTSVGRVGQGIKSVTSNIFSMKGLVTGLVAGAASKTLFDATIGTVDKLERQQRLFKAILGDQEEMVRVNQKVKSLTDEIMDFSKLEAGDAMTRTLRLADGDIDRAHEMVRTAKALEALDPGRGFEGALQAMQMMEFGQVRSLHKFDIDLPSEGEAKDLAKKAGITLGEWYQQALRVELEKKGGGVDALLGIDDASIKTQLSHLKKRLGDWFADIGRDSHSSIAQGMVRVREEFDRLMVDPQIKKDFETLAVSAGEFSAKIMEMAPTFIAKIPEAAKRVSDLFRQVSGFYSRNPGLVKFLAGAVVANHLSGGMLSSAAGGLVRGGVSAALGGRGRGGGAVAATLGGAMGGGCCCGGNGGMGGGMGGKAGSMPWNVGKVGFTAAQAKAMGAGIGASSVAAIAAPFVVAGGLLGLWARALPDMDEVKEREIDENNLPMRAKHEVAQRFHQSFSKGDIAGAAGGLVGMFKGTGDTFEDTAEQRMILKEINAGLGKDVKATLNKGDKITNMRLEDRAAFGVFGTGSEGGLHKTNQNFTHQEALQKLNSEIRKQGTQVTQTNNITINGNATAEDVQKGIEQANDNLVREQRMRQ